MNESKAEVYSENNCKLLLSFMLTIYIFFPKLSSLFLVCKNLFSVIMSKASAAAVLSVAKKASTSRKRRTDDEGVDFEESIESTIEYGPTLPKIPNVASGRGSHGQLWTKIFKQHLPHNTLFLVTALKTVDVHGTDQAMYMDAKLIMQAVQGEDEEDGDEGEALTVTDADKEEEVTSANPYC